MENSTATIDDLKLVKKAHLSKAEQAREDYRYHVAKAIQAENQIKSREGSPSSHFDRNPTTIDFVEYCY